MINVEKKNINILIIEDNPADVRLVSLMLREVVTQAFTMKSAGLLDEGLKLLDEEKFDVVLLDINLPDNYALAGLEKISEKHSGIPVILLTSLDDESIALNALQKNAADYLIKGELNANLLVRSIRYALERHRKENELRKLNQALVALNKSSQAMMHATDESEYLAEVCSIVAQGCGYAMVWIGYAVNDDERSIWPAASAGFEQGYLDTLKLSWADTERGRGPTGTAIRTGKICVCGNMLTDPAFAPWREEALKRGYASSIVLPLTAEGETFGAITIYGRSPGAFADNEKSVLSELTNDTAQGIYMIRLRDERAKAEQALKRDKDMIEKLVVKRTRELLDVQVELERSKRLSDIGTLAATVAHELRNPLGVIRTAVYNIKRKNQNNNLDSHLANIEKKISESNQIINNLLDYSRIKTPHFEKTKICALLDEGIETEKEKYINKKIEFVRRLGPIQDTYVEADPLQIKEVFNNILDNACQAMDKAEGRIEISGKRDDENNVIISFKDNGIGIEKEDIARLFEPFFTRKSKGTGLGLTICKELVKLHNGKIIVESVPGKGTSVLITLPGGGLRQHG